MPSAGTIETFGGYDWRWTAPTDALRGSWTATDSTGVEVLPPSGGISTWMVITLRGERQVLVEVSDQESAWVYAAKKRRSRAN